MTIDPFSSITGPAKPTAPPTTARPPGLNVPTASIPQRIDSLQVAMTPQALRDAYRATLAPAMTTVGAIALGIGLAAVIIAVSFQTAGRPLPLIWGSLMAAAGSGLLLLPGMSSARTMNTLGEDNMMTFDLRITADGLIIEDRNSQRAVRWTEVTAVETRNGHLSVLHSGSPTFQPFRITANTEPFIELLHVHLRRAGVHAGHQPAQIPPIVGGFYVFIALALLLIGVILGAQLYEPQTDAFACPEGQIAVVTQPGGPDAPLKVDCRSV